MTPEELAGYEFAAGSMGPKVEAATRFAAKTGKRAAIGSLADIAAIVAGKAGTNVVRAARRLRDRHWSRYGGHKKDTPAKVSQARSGAGP